MAKKPSISNEARAKVLIELKNHADGCVLTTLNKKLDWNKGDTKRVVDDLLFSGMVYADYLAEWYRTHNLGSILRNLPWLYQISPKGEQFLELWETLEKLRSTEGSYSTI